MNENDLDEHNSRCHVKLPIDEKVDRHRDLVHFLASCVVVVVLGGIIFAVGTVRHRDYLATRANIFARTFILNSPVVEQHLGAVRRVEEVKEQRQTGRAAGWYLDFDVSGRQARGVIDLRLTQSRNSIGWEVPVQWSVPMAILEVGNKSVDLR
jgi:hypothetical protein